jgi:hypothetical protein
MMRSQPFARAAAMFAAVAAAFAIVSLPERFAALQGIGPYKSRGKGGKRARHPSKRFVAQDRRDARKARNRRRSK